MRKTALLILAAILSANGLAMLGWPEAWYHSLSTVPATGPFNAHFVRDIGCASLVSAGGLAYCAISPQHGRSAGLTGAAFLLLHAMVHVWDALAGRATLDHLLTDFISVFGVALLALYLSWTHRSVQ